MFAFVIKTRTKNTFLTINKAIVEVVYTRKL